MREPKHARRTWQWLKDIGGGWTYMEIAEGLDCPQSHLSNTLTKLVQVGLASHVRSYYNSDGRNVPIRKYSAVGDTFEWPEYAQQKLPELAPREQQSIDVDVAPPTPPPPTPATDDPMAALANMPFGQVVALRKSLNDLFDQMTK